MRSLKYLYIESNCYFNDIIKCPQDKLIKFHFHQIGKNKNIIIDSCNIFKINSFESAWKLKNIFSFHSFVLCEMSMCVL